MHTDIDTLKLLLKKEKNSKSRTIQNAYCILLWVCPFFQSRLKSEKVLHGCVEKTDFSFETFFKVIVCIYFMSTLFLTVVFDSLKNGFRIPESRFNSALAFLGHLP